MSFSLEVVRLKRTSPIYSTEDLEALGRPLSVSRREVCFCKHRGISNSMDSVGFTKSEFH